MALAQGSGVYVPPKTPIPKHNRYVVPPHDQGTSTAWYPQLAGTTPSNGVYAFPLTGQEAQYILPQPVAPVHRRAAKFLGGAINTFNPDNYIALYQAMRQDPGAVISNLPSALKKSVTTPEGLGGLSTGLIPVAGQAGRVGAIGREAAVGVAPKVLSQVREASGAPALAENVMTQRAISDVLGAGSGGMNRSGFLKSPEDILAGRDAPMRKVHGQIPAALDIMLKREQESMPFLNQLIKYGNRSSERLATADDVRRGIITHNPDVPHVGTHGPGTLRPSAATDEGRALDEIISRYGDVGGSQYADRGSGLVKPLWQRGEGGPGDFLTQNDRMRPDPFDREFDNWHWDQDMMVPDESAPFVPRQTKNKNARDAAVQAKLDQRKARVQSPDIQAQNFFERAFGSPVETFFNQKWNPEIDILLNKALATRASSGGTGWSKDVIGGAVGDPQAWLAQLLRSPMGFRPYGSHN